MPSEASAIFSEGQLNSHLCGSSPGGIYPIKHTHTHTQTLKGRSGRDLNHIRLRTCPFQKQLAQTDLVPITAGPYQGGTSIRPGPGDFLAQCHTLGRCPHWETVQTLPLAIWAPV